MENRYSASMHIEGKVALTGYGGSDIIFTLEDGSYVRLKDLVTAEDEGRTVAITITISGLGNLERPSATKDL